MDIYPKYKSPFGYQVGDNGVDSYGVDHRNFSLRDEIEYQTARDNRENQMMQMYNQQGITENYPQYTTNFWGDSGNNYGFGSSNISSAISAHPAMNTAPVPITQTPQVQTPTSFGGGSSFSNTGKIANNYFPANEASNYMLDLQNNQCVDMYNNQYAPQNNNITSMYPDYSQPASLKFDGQNLVWLQNGQPVKYYPATSGRADYQSAQYTNERKRGPIPEGDYLLGQGTGEDYNNKEEMSWWRKFVPWNDNPWYENPAAWGKSRIPIQPIPTTNTFGRHSMYVHGGNVPGSAGCIDLTYANDDFYNDFKNYNGTLPLKVKYKKGW